MNLKEIAIFKRFMGQLELRKNFIKKYKRSIGMTRNPQSIEKYSLGLKSRVSQNQYGMMIVMNL